MTTANFAPEDTWLVDQAVTWLQTALPSTFTVERSARVFAGDNHAPAQPLDGVIDVRTNQGVILSIAVEAKEYLPPRDVDKVLAGVARIFRALAGNIPILVVSRWLSPRTQELLADRGINFVDLTGNALIKVDNPAIYVKSVGATRDPEPQPRGRARVRGPKAARLVRLLADVRPPYGVRDIADAAQLAPGYVSRLLDALDREALIERSRRGQVQSVDVSGLLRRWVDSYDVFKTNSATGFVAPPGVKDALSRLGEMPAAHDVAITGSFAAVRVAPVAAPALLIAYCADTARVETDLGLLAADEGANVMLLKPFDPVVWERTTEDGGLRYVAPTQAAVDCLTGNGRMPAEGEALLTWMTANEHLWRLESLADVQAWGAA